tara:strand:- start:4267 stop:4722 length:456 start_codon:yes stop_codon:yes gene_type:complete
MLTMANVFLIFGLLLIAATIGTLYWSVRSYRMYRANLLVSHELDKILGSTLETIQKTKNSGVRPSGMVKPAGESVDMLDSPDMMATIITVLVNKFGNVRLSMQDFLLSDEDYVSVYVDANTQEIVLSLDHNLDVSEMYSGFKGPTDDSTFH